MANMKVPKNTAAKTLYLLRFLTTEGEERNGLPPFWEIFSDKPFDIFPTVNSNKGMHTCNE